MPKVQYTGAKGLHQVAGSGVDLTTSTGNVHMRRPVIAVSAAATLNANQSGAIINLSSSNYAVNLPQDPEPGTYFTFMNTAALSSDGTINIDAKDGEEFFKGVVLDLEGTADDANVTFNGSSHDQLKFASGAAAQENWITITFIGANIWWVHDSYSQDASDITQGTASGNA